MVDAGAAPFVAILAVTSVALAVALPILVVRRTARPDDLRERILLSRPRWVEGRCIGSIIGQALGAGAFAVLAAVGHPVLWGVVALSLGSIVGTAVYLDRFRRALRALEAELVRPSDAEDERRV